MVVDRTLPKLETLLRYFEFRHYSQTTYVQNQRVFLLYFYNWTVFNRFLNELWLRRIVDCILNRWVHYHIFSNIYILPVILGSHLNVKGIWLYESMYPDSGIHETIFNVYSSPSSFGVCNEFMFLESCIDDALPIRILFLKYVFLGVLLTKKVWNLLEDPKYILSKLIESKY